MGSTLKDLNVIVTAAGAPGAPGIIKSLRLNGERRIRVIGTDMNNEAVGLFMADKGYVVPPGGSDEFIPRMLEVAEKEEIDVILPLATYELMSFSKNKDKFEDIGVKIPVSNPRSLEIANNKGLLFDCLRKHNIPVPKSVRVNTFRAFEKAVYALGYPDIPVCFKPQVGKGSRGFRVLDKNVDKLDRLLNYKPDNTVTTFDDIIPVLEAADPFPELVVMEYLPGKEYSVDLLVKNGEPLITIPRPRDVIKLGISFIGRVEKKTEVANMADKIVQAIGLDYNINLQLKYSNEDIPKIIEINPRVSGTIVLCTGAGVNLPYLGVKMVLGEKISDLEPMWGTKMIRYWDEVFISQDGRSYQLKI